MGSNKSETTTTKDETTTTRPLPEQMPRLEKAWSEADKIYDLSKANPYLGNFIAAPNAGQYQSMVDSGNWAKGAARDQATAMGQAGQAQLAAGQQGQYGALAGLFQAANTDQTAGNIAKAQQYASAQNVSDIVRAAMFDARREAGESTLPSLYRSAGASGGINSDRAALAEGVVNRGLAEQALNTSATVRSNLLSQGLTMAQAQNAQQLQALGAAGSLGSTLSGQGYAGSQAGFDNYGKALTAQQASAFGQNALDQQVLDNDLKKWYAQYQQPWTNLQQYYGVVGDLKGGTARTTGTSTSETTQTPSMLSMIGQGIGVFGSLFCDRRAKVVLSGPVGTFEGIVPTYFYTYRDDPSSTLYCGPMAQEVEMVRPDAIIERNGWKFIDLSAFRKDN